MSRKKKDDSPVSFQITPMIDMTFLLLVFFMVTSKLTEQKVKKDISLPQASASIRPKDHSQRDVINIDDNGRYFIADAEVSNDQLNEFLKKRYGVNTPYVIYLRADQNMPAKKIGEFMEMATEAGVDRVIFGVLNE
ncbi:MAG: biopolymer transporter ExbD [Verrucomicrobiales bacterium]|nr:biopolymer transporter ExbD [Verrucomicrobiales bacterium]